MKKARPNGKVVMLTEEALSLTKEEVILILEMDFVVIVLDMVKKGIYTLSIDPLVRMNKVIKML